MKHSLFRWSEARAPLTTLLVVVGVLMTVASHAEATNPGTRVSGSAAITTDYVWRGSSQSQGDPAAQAGFKLAGASGLYASAWGSTVKFDPLLGASTELDLSAGWAGSLAQDWTLDVNLLHYRYPDTQVDLDWTELNGTVTYKGNYWASIGYSNEALGANADGTYVLIGARFPVNDAFRIEANLGHYFLDDTVFVQDGYSHATVSAIWAFKAPFELRLSAHATDTRAEHIFGKPLAGNRFEAALQASF